MKVVARTVYGPPEVLTVEERPRPEPRPKEVLIRIVATALNASDLELLTGDPLYGRVNGPFRPRTEVLGSDVAGWVEAVGSDVTRFKPGDAVYGDIFERWGGLAEWVSVPERMLRAKPEFLTFEQAASLPQSGAIAIQGIVTKGGVKAGHKVLVNGAGGGGGSFAIQIAKAIGAHVTAVDSTHKVELMRLLGADRAVSYQEEDITENDTRFDVILDLVGHHSIPAYRRILSRRGRYQLVGGPMSDVFGVLFKGAFWSLFSQQKLGVMALRVNQGLDELEGFIERGAVRPAIDCTFALEETAAALRYFADGKVRGKVIIRCSDE